MKGIEAKERTFIASQSERSMLESLSKSLDGVDDIKKLRSAFKKISNLKKKPENMGLVENLWMRLKNLSNPLSAGMIFELFWQYLSII